MSQTTIQKSSAIRTGSAKLEVSLDGATWKDVGAMRKVAVKSLGKTDVIKFDNVDEIKKFSDGNKFSISFELAEINWEILEIMRNGHINTVVNSGVDTRVNFAQSGLLVAGYARITNTDANGKTFKMNFENVTMTSEIELPFISDDTADVMTMPVTLEGYAINVNPIVDAQSA